MKYLLLLIPFLFSGCFFDKEPEPKIIYVDRNVTVNIPVACKHQKCTKGTLLDFMDTNLSFTQRAQNLKYDYSVYEEYSLCLLDSISKCEK